MFVFILYENKCYPHTYSRDSCRGGHTHSKKVGERQTKLVRRTLVLSSFFPLPLIRLQLLYFSINPPKEQKDEQTNRETDRLYVSSSPSFSS
mmetsp:Transcript_32123/g.63707  ORF Transcript_32123/g.63707 Transcript_32123/m.63707 type:complete len:92 (+) Transcript_32123:436-711(+)